MIIRDSLKLIGNTPTYKMKDSNIYVKLEKFNAGGSIKDRAALGMIEDAERRGILKEDSVLVEATSGNTGIAIAMIGKLKGYKVIIVMPDSMSEERRRIIQSYGAELILTEGAKGMKGSIELADEMAANDSRYFVMRQFSNPANREIHYETTSLELLEDVPDMDIFVAGVGTGGTFSGIAKRFKEQDREILCVAAEPSDSAVISGEEPGPHKIQGIGAGFITDIFLSEYMDEVIKIDYDYAERETVNFVRDTGILVGLSTGANIAAAKMLAEKYGHEKKIVTIAPDGGEKYMSLGIFG
ncbi:cysteine synthase A [Dethiosulfatibacter aminovorans DSM 17477]|uniref:Cysteine synthase n=1 Tax=Dethiosulfatibacter aminovorans DSM 17477 TaxID=1121476 RepID=A0A1M6FRX7_9FIRM|nr:cysteine synthase A [Dethiosulfatibacter aminovorans]SHJ00447.1 cysteine synthase A [Dethiosulfatibacter aminovorans DSM 17477]